MDLGASSRVALPLQADRRGLLADPPRRGYEYSSAIALYRTQQESTPTWILSTTRGEGTTHLIVSRLTSQDRMPTLLGELGNGFDLRARSVQQASLQGPVTGSLSMVRGSLKFGKAKSHRTSPDKTRCSTGRIALDSAVRTVTDFPA